MASVVSNMLLKWVPDFSSCHKICLCNPWVTRVKFVLVFPGNLKVNLQTLEVLVFSKTIRNVSLPKLTVLDGSRGHFPWSHVLYTHLPFVCLLSGGDAGVTEPTSSLPAAKIPFLTITEKIPLWNCFCFKPWGINYFSRIESFLECLYPAFALHNANLCIRTHEPIDLSYRISPCRGLWVFGALGWEAGSLDPLLSCCSRVRRAAEPSQSLTKAQSIRCLTPEPNQTPWQNWVPHCTPCSPPLEGRAQRE